MGALGTVSGVSFVSLQKGTREGEADTEAGAWLVARLGPEMEDLADAAAVIDALDLVICVDTALAHLAGALGKPVWVLLPTPADFRWMEGREDSPWYPTMRLFRQRVRGEWGEVIERVRAALEEVVRGGAVLPKVPEPTPMRLRGAGESSSAGGAGPSAGDERGGGDAARDPAVFAGRGGGWGRAGLVR